LAFSFWRKQRKKRIIDFSLKINWLEKGGTYAFHWEKSTQKKHPEKPFSGCF
jgi:hypothetical protein